MSNLEFPVRRPMYRMHDLKRNGGGRTPFSESYLYREIKEGNFPQGKIIAPNVRVWTEEVIEAEMQRRFRLYNKPENCGGQVA